MMSDDRAPAEPSAARAPAGARSRAAGSRKPDRHWSSAAAGSPVCPVVAAAAGPRRRAPRSRTSRTRAVPRRPPRPGALARSPPPGRRAALDLHLVVCSTWMPDAPLEVREEARVDGHVDEERRPRRAPRRRAARPATGPARRLASSSRTRPANGSPFHHAGSSRGAVPSAATTRPRRSSVYEAPGCTREQRREPLAAASRRRRRRPAAGRRAPRSRVARTRSRRCARPRACTSREAESTSSSTPAVDEEDAEQHDAARAR